MQVTQYSNCNIMMMMQTKLLYVDVIVHRLLGACIGVEGYSSKFMEKKKMAELCDGKLL
jgi:hypothetical protein